MSVRDRVVSPSPGGISSKDDRQRPTAPVLGSGPNSLGKQPITNQPSSVVGASSAMRSATGGVWQSSGRETQLSPVTTGPGGSGIQTKLSQPLATSASLSTHCSDSILIDQSRKGDNCSKGISEQKVSPICFYIPHLMKQTLKSVRRQTRP